VAKLIARLQQAFELPGGVTGLKADVRLTIAADGTMISAVLVASSGNDQFDAAVNAALQRLTHVEPPPGGQQVAYTFTYTPNG
jgi:TonB family protein